MCEQVILTCLPDEGPERPVLHPGDIGDEDCVGGTPSGCVGEVQDAQEGRLPVVPEQGSVDVRSFHEVMSTQQNASLPNGTEDDDRNDIEGDCVDPELGRSILNVGQGALVEGREGPLGEFQCLDMNEDKGNLHGMNGMYDRYVQPGKHDPRSTLGSMSV